jgi:hypothetical protein
LRSVAVIRTLSKAISRCSKLCYVSAVRKPDTLTIIAISLLSAALVDVLHEALGHGGACVLSGAQPLVLSTVHFECSIDSRWIAAGGTVVNLIVGTVCWVLLRRIRTPRLRYFVWLTIVFNFLDGFGYFLYSGIANIGDWSYVIHDWQPPWAWRVGLTVVGLVLYYLTVLMSGRELGPLLPATGPERPSFIRRLTFLAYFANGVLLTVAGIFNPVGWKLVVISAMAASFGGTSGLLWMGSLIKAAPPSTLGSDAPVIERSWAWIAAGVLVAALFILVLGPSLRLSIAAKG